MPKPILIVYSQDFPNCSSIQEALINGFDIVPVGTSEQFLSKMRTLGPDGGIICFCSAHSEDKQKLLRLKSLAGLVPIITCSKTLLPDFVRTAAEQGIQCFLCCAWADPKIVTAIDETIRRDGIQELLEVCRQSGHSFSSHVPKIAHAIIHTFPHRLRESELAEQLGMSQRWLRTLCRQAFNRTFIQVRRRILVRQALRLMKYTNLDDTEIALQLNYGEEGSMFRDFYKELGYSYIEARKGLATHTPEELLL